MLGRKRGGGSSTCKPTHAEDPDQYGLTGGTGAATDGGQEVAASHFVAQLDEAAQKRLDSMNQRLRWLEQQMEMLEAEVGKASA